MVKFELEVSTSSWTCLSIDKRGSRLLCASPGCSISSLLADDQEFQDLTNQTKTLAKDSRRLTSDDNDEAAFATFNLVFRAPGATTSSETIDRSPINGVFRSPIRAIHLSGEQEICCLVHLEMKSNKTLLLTAVELSRKYRENMLRQEFGSWLLEDHIEQAVIATDPLGTVVFWNRFACELYQYSHLEALGQNIMGLTPSEMTQEQGMEIFTKLQQGEHWKGFFGVKRKDKSRFMAHVTDTPVLDQDSQLKFIVGVSADYSQMHDLMEKLRNLNANLEQEVEIRTKALLDRERSLRMVGAAVQQSDTGVIIADDEFHIVWSNDAAQNLLQQSHDQLKATMPWNLPLDFHPHMGRETDLENSSSSSDESDSDGERSIRPQQDGRALHDKVQDFFKSGPNSSQNTMYAFSKCDQEGGGSGGHGSDGRRRLFLSLSVQGMTDCKNRMIVIRDLTVEREADEAHRRAEREAAASRSKTEMIQMLSHEFRTPLQGIMGVVSTILLDLKPDGVGGLYESLSTIAASSRLLLTLINNVLDLGKMDAKKMQQIDLLLSSIQDALTFCEPFAKMNECQLTLKDYHDDTTHQGSSILQSLMVVANKLRLEQILINLVSNAVKYSGVGKEVQVGVRMASNQEAVAEALAAGACDLKMSPPEVVDAALSASGDVAIVTVRDQGRGIPQEEFGKLFGEFNQLAISKQKDNNNNSNNSKRKRKAHAIGQSSGSGLGLCLVLKFVSLMKGHIWVTNADSGGAEFHFSFPQATSSAALVSTGGGKDPVPISPRGPALDTPKAVLEKFGTLRVLLLDDSLINLKVLKRMLARLGVHQVQIFSEGGKAIAALQRESQTSASSRLPTLIMTDLEMPTMSGFDFLKSLRGADVYNDQIPTVIACSADWTAETEKRCHRAGFDGFLRKPIVLSALRDFLASHMKDAPPVASETLPRKDITLIGADFSSYLQKGSSKTTEVVMEDGSTKLGLLGAPNLIDLSASGLLDSTRDSPCPYTNVP